ncbi:MAG: hypothetical protein ACI4GA_02105 [Acutalibacteraceae bacterium]
MKNNNNKAPHVDKPWLKIDNASTLYAAARYKDWCRTYRSAIILDREVDKDILQQALADTAKRFPSFCVTLRDGLFWSYFERTDAVPIVHTEEKYPYRPIQLDGTDQPCFRVLCYKNRIAIEVFHSLTDGTGTGVFLATLTRRYLELCGEQIPDSEKVFNVNDEPLDSETRDSYYDYYDPSVSAKNPKKADVYLNENNKIKNYSRIVHGLFTVDNIHSVAKKYNLTITEYLTAVLIYTFNCCEKKPINKPISISIPIDLRRRFESKTVRNFVYMTDVSFNPKGRKDVSFNEICDEIRGKLAQKASNDNLRACISANVSAASNKIIRPIPYPIKKAFLKRTYKNVQESYTAFISNGGEMVLPPEMAKHVLRAEGVLADNPYVHFGCAAVSINGLFNLTFSSDNADTEKQKFFFRFLANDGVNVRIESNVYE